MAAFQPFQPVDHTNGTPHMIEEYLKTEVAYIKGTYSQDEPVELITYVGGVLARGHINKSTETMFTLFLQPLCLHYKYTPVIATMRNNMREQLLKEYRYAFKAGTRNVRDITSAVLTHMIDDFQVVEVVLDALYDLLYNRGPVELETITTFMTGLGKTTNNQVRHLVCIMVAKLNLAIGRGDIEYSVDLTAFHTLQQQYLSTHMCQISVMPHETCVAKCHELLQSIATCGNSQVNECVTKAQTWFLNNTKLFPTSAEHDIKMLRHALGKYLPETDAKLFNDATYNMALFRAPPTLYVHMAWTVTRKLTVNARYVTYVLDEINGIICRSPATEGLEAFVTEVLIEVGRATINKQVPTLLAKLQGWSKSKTLQEILQ